MDQTTGSPSTLNATIGALEIGVLVSTFLFGVATLQAWTYYRGSTDDVKILKILVGTIWVLELGVMISDSYGIYSMTVSYFGQPMELLVLPQNVNISTCLVSTLLTGFIVTIVQTYYALLIHQLTKWLHAAILCGLGTAAFLVISIIVAIMAFENVFMDRFWDAAESLLDAGLILAASTDVVVSFTLCYYFINQKNFALQRTARVLDRLIALSIQSGLVTSIVAVAAVIMFQTMKTNFVWFALYIPLPGLYANSLLALLNARPELRRDSVGAQVINFNTVRDTVLSPNFGNMQLRNMAFAKPPSEKIEDDAESAGSPSMVGGMN